MFTLLSHVTGYEATDRQISCYSCVDFSDPFHFIGLLVSFFIYHFGNPALNTMLAGLEWTWEKKLFIRGITPIFYQLLT